MKTIIRELTLTSGLFGIVFMVLAPFLDLFGFKMFADIFIQMALILIILFIPMALLDTIVNRK